MKKQPAPYAIRTANEFDADAISALLRQLGYKVPNTELLERIREIKQTAGEIFVAVQHDGRVVGCVQAIRELRLAEGKFAELVSLVVDEQCRKAGLGGLLTQAVENWCTEQGLNYLRIRSNNQRSGALRFYAKAGFIQKKEQAVLEKTLASL